MVIKTNPPITIKKDTLEFNAASFKTKKNANVEDLLKELPGVEVDEDGKITINGQDVNQILVNGEPFFGNDPTITTRSLTKDIIKKIQITDTRTKAQAFAGEKGERENKTINLTIKEEHNKGSFGHAILGSGTDNHYEFSGLLNSFNNSRRFSVLVGGNDINAPGFRLDGRVARNTIRSGVVTSRNLGTNYTNKIGKKIDVNGDYFYAKSDTENESSRERENILPDTRFFSNTNSSSFRRNESHRASTRFNIKADSTLLINIRPSFNYSKSESVFSDNSESLDEFNVRTNQSSSNSISENSNKSFNNNIDITKRLNNKGSFARVYLNNSLSNNEGDNELISKTEIFEDDGVTLNEEINRNQITDRENKNNNISYGITYRMALQPKTFFVDFNFRGSNNVQENTENTFDFNEVTQTYNDFINEDLSTDFKYKNKIINPSLRFEYNKEKWSFNLDNIMLFRTLENKDRLRDINIKRNFKALELRANYNYRFNSKTRLRASYVLDNSPPDLGRLQPFQDVSNPLNTITGNPNLEPKNEHRLNLRFNSNNYQKGIDIFGRLGATFVDNETVSRTIVDENFVRNTTYVNVNGNYRLNAGSFISKRVKIDTVKTIRYGLGVFSNYNKNINFNNGVQYASNTASVTPVLNVTFTWKDVFEIRPNYRLSYTKTKFDIEEFNNQEFLRHNLGLRYSSFVPERVEWINDVNFSYNPNIAAGFQRSAWFWNSTLTYDMIKDRGYLSLKVYDLLNQNTNARRTTTANYIEDSQSTVLRQYFLLSFRWKFKKGAVKA